MSPAADGIAALGPAPPRANGIAVSGAAAALAWHQQVIAIYAKFAPGDENVTQRPVLAHQVAASILEQQGNAAAAEASLAQAIAAAGRAQEPIRGLLEDRALDQIAGFYFARERYAEAGAALERRVALSWQDRPLHLKLDLDSDLGWLAYWQGDFDLSRKRFERLQEPGSEVAESAVQGLGGVADVPRLLDLATAQGRAGDEQAALRTIGRAKLAVESVAGQSFAEYVETIESPWPWQTDRRRV